MTSNGERIVDLRRAILRSMTRTELLEYIDDLFRARTAKQVIAVCKRCDAVVPVEVRGERWQRERGPDEGA